VFGSVVGCVVVPIVSQIIKTQSMECVILSAIVISLTAAHLKTSKKSDVPNTKIVFKEAEKRKVVHTNSKKKNNVKEQLHRQAQEELEYIQQFEHLKIQELEKRQEDKKLKKMKKREEKLRLRKENELKTAQGVKTRKQKKEEDVKSVQNSSPPSNLSQVSGSANVKQPKDRASESFYSTSENRHLSIPRFESQQRRQRLASDPRSTSSSSIGLVTPQKVKPTRPHATSSPTPLTIKCSNFSGSCSSLSSLSSSGSSELASHNSPSLIKTPPPAATPASAAVSPWKLPVQNISSTPLWMPGQDDPPAPRPQSARPMSSASTDSRSSSVSSCSTRHDLSGSLDSSFSSQPVVATNRRPNTAACSLFCAPLNSYDHLAVLLDSARSEEPAKLQQTEPEICGAEYSLFGPPRVAISIGQTAQ